MSLALEIIVLVYLSFTILSLLKYIMFILLVLVVDKRLMKKEKQHVSTTSENVSDAPTKGIKRLIGNLYEGVYRYLAGKVAYFPSNKVRLFLYRHLFQMKIGKNVVIHYGLRLRRGYLISIGEGTIVGDRCELDGRGVLTIGKNVNISSNASIYTVQHIVNDVQFQSKAEPVTIMDRAWISSNTVILPGVVVGEGTVLASGGIATKNLDEFSVYGGIPAKKIADRNKNIDYNLNGTSGWFY